MSKSPRHRWQTRWTVSDDRTTVTHETGLVCRAGPGGLLVDNAQAIQAQLAVKNGPGNAPVMLRRLMAEAQAVLDNGATWGARLKA
jgi:hypothetical protein